MTYVCDSFFFFVSNLFFFLFLFSYSCFIFLFLLFDTAKRH